MLVDWKLIEDFYVPHADIKCTTDLEIELKTLMSNIEEIILQLDPSSGVCKGRVVRIDERHHSHLNSELLVECTIYQVSRSMVRDTSGCFLGSRFFNGC